MDENDKVIPDDDQIIYTGCLAIHSVTDDDHKPCLFFTIKVGSEHIDPATGMPTAEGFQNALSAIVYLEDLKWVPSTQVNFVPKGTVDPSIIWHVNSTIAKK